MPKSAPLDIVAADDTIAAIATAPGVGAIGIVRMSGPGAVSTAAACFHSSHGSLGNLPSHQLHHGHWVNPGSGQAIDEVLLAVMPGPRSYTGEDVVEIYGHGGPLVLQEILRAALTAGARPARAGEFTLRAFRSGRVDLLQAEAVADLIEARTDSARRLALRALRGGWSERVAEMKARVLELLAHLETHLEFPLEDVEPMPESELQEALAGLGREVEQLLGMARRRGVYRRGLFTVITGRPNVGKSLLFNRILGRERALVTEYPGTTRDTVEETVRFGGVELHLVDSAGGREAAAHVEQLGVQRTLEAVRQADQVWFLVDAQAGVTAEDERWLRQVVEQAGQGSGRFVLVINKIDLVKKIPAIDSPLFRRVFPEGGEVRVSARTGEGLDALCGKTESLAVRQGQVAGESDLLVNQRQEHLLEGMQEAFRRIEDALAGGLSLDVVAGDLWDVKGALDQMDGTRVSGDLLGEIFSRFCIGK